MASFFGGSPDTVFAPFGARRAEAQALYDPDGKTPIQIYGWQAAGDRMFLEPARAVARAMAADGAPVRAYRFSYVAESQRKEWWGAPHATEIPFVFDTADIRYGAAYTPADDKAAKAAHAYWIAFAKAGGGQPAGLPAWPVLRASDDRILDLAAEARVVTDPVKARLDLVETTAQGSGR